MADDPRSPVNRLCMVVAAMLVGLTAVSPGQEGQTETTRSFAYVTETRRWLQFPLTPNAWNLRLLSNAAIPPETPEDSGEEWGYSLEVEVDSGSGEILLSRILELRTRSSSLTNERSGAPASSPRFVGSDLRPADTRVTRLRLPVARRAAFLRVALASATPPIRDVTVRVYVEETLARRKLSGVWQRLSDRSREHLGRNSAHPVEMLSEVEQQLLAGRSWKPLAPTGIEDEAWVRRNLEMPADARSVPAPPEIPPLGLITGPGQIASIPVSAELTSLRLEVQCTDGPQKGAVAQITWHGRALSGSRSWDLPLVAPITEKVFTIGPGVIEVAPSEAAAVRVYSVEPGGTEITPDPVQLRIYPLAPDAPLEYRHISVSGDATPFRIDLRRLIRGELDPQGEPAAVTCTLLAKGGEVLDSWLLAADGPASLHDRVAGPGGGPGVSDPTRWYLQISPAVAAIGIAHHIGAVGVAVYNRPPRRPAVVYLPEATNPESPLGRKSRVWFPLRPVDQGERLDAGDTLLLDVQSRAVETDERLQEGDYSWLAFRPEGSWRGRNVLQPRDPLFPRADGTFDSPFVLLEPRTDVELTFRSGRGGDRPRPRLVLELPPAPGTHRIRCRIGPDALDLGELPGGLTTVLPLGAVVPGRATLRLEVPRGTRAWIDEVDPRGSETWSLRLLASTATGIVVFPVAKEAPATRLLLRFHAAAEELRRSRLLVSLSPIDEGPSTPGRFWTQARRLVDMAPPDGPVGPVLNSARLRLGPGRTVVVPLNDDIPPGQYKLSVSVEEGPQGYLSLATMLPGGRPRLSLSMRARAPPE